MCYNEINIRRDAGGDGGNLKESDMTENQRDYLADLAIKKGMRLEDTDDKSPAWASKTIEELKAMPDISFSDFSETNKKAVSRIVGQAKQEIQKWGWA